MLDKLGFLHVADESNFWLSYVLVTLLNFVTALALASAVTLGITLVL